MMRKPLIALISFGAAIAGCSENPHVTSASSAAAPVSATPTAANVLDGAAVGAPIAGLAGAVWADPDNTGYVTGYTLNGKYSPGAPPGYDPARHIVVSPH